MIKKFISCLCLVLALTGCVQITVPENTPAQTEKPTGMTANDAPAQPAETTAPAQPAETTAPPTAEAGVKSSADAQTTMPAATALPSPDTTAVVPIRAGFVTETNAETPFPPSFADGTANCFFNQREVMTAGNNPGPIGSAGLAVNNDFAWALTVDGKATLMALVDTDDPWSYRNGNLILPGYGAPAVNMYGSSIELDWGDRDNAYDGVRLTFTNGGDTMFVSKNILKGVSGPNNGYKVDLAAAVYGDDSSFFLPVNAIVNELGGGVLRNPLGDGSDFIYTGDAIMGYAGMWETPDKSAFTAGGLSEGETLQDEYRTDVVIDGKTVSVCTYWSGLELRPDGTFTESDRYYQDEGDWVLTEQKGRYAFFGRILAMCYETESEYRGPDYSALIPVKVDVPVENWGKIPGAAVYARYVDEWDENHLQIRDWNTMYANMAQTAAPRPGIKK